MKYTNRIMRGSRLLAIIASITLVSSCKNFLELKPISISSVDAFYKTQDDFMQAVNGAYSAVTGQYGAGYYMLFADLRADNTTMLGIGGGTEQQKISIDNFTIDATNEHTLQYWTYAYIAIQRANGVLSNIKAATFDQAKKDQYTGESEAIRALTYFNLVRMFGGVPIVTVGDVNIGESYNTPRSSVDDVYKLIVSDLTDAISKLPTTYGSADAGRVTKGAAQSLLGQVYLVQKKYSDAATVLKSVITDGNYALLSKYENNFTGTDQGNKEAIWQILYKSSSNGAGSNYPNWCAPLGSETVLIPQGGAYGFNQPTLDIFNAYTPGDLRRDVSIGVGFTSTAGVFVNARYIKLYVDRNTGSGYNDSDADWNVLRYSYVMLMCAEALNEANSSPTADAYNYINQVRSRAGLAPLSALSQSAFRNAVYLEERLEVAFEGQRWFDLVRTGTALSVMNSKLGGSDPVGPSAAVSQNQLLYPIPTNVIMTSSPGIITQNPGY